MTSANQINPDVKKTSRRLPWNKRRRELIDAAREVFLAKGYQPASMDDIAEHAGVSKPVLYQHFPGKWELYLTVLQLILDELTKRIRDAVDLPVSNKLRLEAVIRACFDWVTGEDEARL